MISMIIHNPFILEFTVKNSTFFCLRDEKLWHSNFLIWLLSYESVVYWTLKSDIYMNFSVQREPCKNYTYFCDWTICIIVPILDGRLEHVAHTWRKTGVLWNNFKCAASVNVNKCLKQIKLQILLYTWDPPTNKMKKH